MPFRSFQVTSGNEREAGDIGIFVCFLVLVVAISIPLLFRETLIHKRIVEAYIRGYQEEYEIEGVLTEAIALLEEKGEGFVAENIPSSFAPSYKFTLASGTITLTKDGKVVLRATIQWQDGKLSVVSAENEVIRPFTQ